MDTQIETGRRLLVVDDEPVQCLIVTQAMTAFGYMADSATSLEEATARITHDGYDIVVLDLSVGERAGISVLRLLASSPGDPVVVFMSRQENAIHSAGIQFARELGLRIAGTIANPMRPSALRALLTEVT